MCSAFKYRRKLTSRIAVAFLWFTALAIMALFIFSSVLPQDLSRATPIYSRLVAVAFFGRVLSFHLALILAGITAITLPLRRWCLCFICGVTVLIAGYPSLVPRNTSATVGPTLRVMSMNLKYSHSNPELIVDQVRRFNPDVLVLQDFTPFAQAALERDLGGDYPHRCLELNYFQGLAIYSRKPFEGAPARTFTAELRQIRAVVKLNDHPVVIYVEHPFSPRSLQRIIANRKATAYLAAEVMTERDPVIVAGDFNFTDNTPNADALRRAGLSDTFDMAGHGRGSTWPVQPRWLQWLPGFRIDHIYASPQLSCTRISVGEYDGSDHLPIVADVGRYH